ncbi:MAG: histidinol dehydrogenase, partial [Pseudomonadota bacterium]|nr:histidinol dehydrogenase [Pseudomonadota bacterium]
MPLRLDQKSDDFEAKFEEFVAAKRDIEEDVDSTAAEIIEAVRRDGDKAVAAYTEKFDRLSLASSKFAVGLAEIDAAIDECD